MRSEDRHLATPVMIAVGAQSRTVVVKPCGDPARPRHRKLYRRARGGGAEVETCSVTVIAESGHKPHLEQPAALLAAGGAFLKRTAAGFAARPCGRPPLSRRNSRAIVGIRTAPLPLEDAR